MNHISEYSPYIYLKKIDNERYRIFVTILHYRNQTVELRGKPKVFYANGSAILNFDIKGGTNEGTRPTERHHASEILLPTLDTKVAFDPNSFFIEVNTNCYLNEQSPDRITLKQSLKVLYTDADDQLGSTHEDIALQSPYLFLTNPSSEIGSNPEQYNPFCLLFVKGFAMKKASYQQDTDGVFIQELQLAKKRDSGEIQMIEPSTIPANTNEYLDLDEVTGYFETLVFENSAGRANEPIKRKGKLRNVSADVNPTKFS